MRSRPSLRGWRAHEDGTRLTERIGILGGTFDPIHVAHLTLAAQARHQLRLDRVLFVVANVPWQKVATRQVSAAEDRFEMVQAAVAAHPGMEASRIEIDRGGDSYTADTLAELRRPDCELFLIIGSDLVDELHTWKRSDELPMLCTLAIAHRPGGPEPTALLSAWDPVTIDMPALELSSSELRTMVAQGRPVDFLVPGPAEAVITRRNLYQVAAPAGLRSTSPKQSDPLKNSLHETTVRGPSARVLTNSKETTLSTITLPSGSHALSDATAEIRRLAVAAARSADEKKGTDVLVLDVSDTLSITDAFVIVSAPNTRLVATIAESVEMAVKHAGGSGPIATEGLSEASWVLLDFGGFVVHVFLEETRRYYDLERLWADAPTIAWT